MMKFKHSFLIASVFMTLNLFSSQPNLGEEAIVEGGFNPPITSTIDRMTINPDEASSNQTATKKPSGSTFIDTVYYGVTKFVPKAFGLKPQSRTGVYKELHKTRKLEGDVRNNILEAIKRRDDAVTERYTGGSSGTRSVEDLKNQEDIKEIFYITDQLKTDTGKNFEVAPGLAQEYCELQRQALEKIVTTDATVNQPKLIENRDKLIVAALTQHLTNLNSAITTFEQSVATSQHGCATEIQGAQSSYGTEFNILTHHATIAADNTRRLDAYAKKPVAQETDIEHASHYYEDPNQDPNAEDKKLSPDNYAKHLVSIRQQKGFTFTGTHESPKYYNFAERINGQKTQLAIPTEIDLDKIVSDLKKLENIIKANPLPENNSTK